MMSIYSTFHMKKTQMETTRANAIIVRNQPYSMDAKNVKWHSILNAHLQLFGFYLFRF